MDVFPRHFLCKSSKRRSWDDCTGAAFTGMPTRPKEMEPVQTGRSMVESTSPNDRGLLRSLYPEGPEGGCQNRARAVLWPHAETRRRREGKGLSRRDTGLDGLTQKGMKRS